MIPCSCNNFILETYGYMYTYKHIMQPCTNINIYIHTHIYIVKASFEDMNPCAYNMQMYMQKTCVYIYIHTVFQCYTHLETHTHTCRYLHIDQQMPWYGDIIDTCINLKS